MQQIATTQPAVFCPSAWLDTFRDNGGYWFTIADSISIGVMLNGDDAKERAARQMLASVQADPRARQTLRDHILTTAGRA